MYHIVQSIFYILYFPFNYIVSISFIVNTKIYLIYRILCILCVSVYKLILHISIYTFTLYISHLFYMPNNLYYFHIFT